MARASDGKRRTRNIVAGAVALLIGIGGGVFFALQGGDSGQVAGEIILQPAADIGADPFDTSPIFAAPDPKLAQAATPIATQITAKAGQATTATSGGTPGLYGGTQNQASCDAQQLVDSLIANPDKAKAWVDALNADPAVALPDGSKLAVANIPNYVASLTPLVLRDDTRVTNHGFKNGKANPIQSVLQKGTAVLIDNRGVPRTRCYCGNPLVPAVASKTAPKYTGSTWPGFSPTKISFIPQNNTVINNFVVTNLATGQTFTQPAGSSITQAGGSPTTTVPGATTLPGTTTAPTTAAPATTLAQATTAPPATTAAAQCDSWDQSAITGANGLFDIVNNGGETIKVVWYDDSQNCAETVIGTLQPGDRIDQYSFPEGARLFGQYIRGGAVAGNAGSFVVVDGGTWTLQ